MKKTRVGLLKAASIISLLLLVLSLLVFRALDRQLRRGDPVPDWFRYAHDAINPYLVLVLPVVLIWVVWTLARINRPSKRPKAVDLATENDESSSAATSSEADDFQRISDAQASWPSLTTGTSYLDTRIILLAGFMIWLCLEFLRHVLLPSSVNQWIDKHHLGIALSILATVFIYWLYDTFFGRLTTGKANVSKPASRLGLLLKRLGLCAVGGAVYFLGHIMNWVTYQLEFSREIPENYTLIAALALGLSLLIRR